MSKIKIHVKQNMFAFILGGLIFGSIGVCAATFLSSSSVSYSNATSGIASTNVQDAIDELYNKAKNPETTATATAEQILSGQTAWVNGVKLTGTMLNQGAKTATINPGGSYTIPAGYHNGSGKITANPNQNSGTYTYAANSTGGTVDLGVNNTYRYVNATNVYNKGKADGLKVKTDTLTLSGGGTKIGSRSTSKTYSDVGTIKYVGMTSSNLVYYSWDNGNYNVRAKLSFSGKTVTAVIEGDVFVNNGIVSASLPIIIVYQ